MRTLLWCTFQLAVVVAPFVAVRSGMALPDIPGPVLGLFILTWVFSAGALILRAWRWIDPRDGSPTPPFSNRRLVQFLWFVFQIGVVSVVVYAIGPLEGTLTVPIMFGLILAWILTGALIGFRDAFCRLRQFWNRHRSQPSGDGLRLSRPTWQRSDPGEK